MNGFQETIIVGNLGGDPEMRYLPDGAAVTNFSVAVNHKQGDSETVTWYRVAA
jgi:single-strand DNA-binding protein